MGSTGPGPRLYSMGLQRSEACDSSLPQPVVGEVVNPVNNITLNTNGKAYGARFRVYPLPLDSNLRHVWNWARPRSMVNGSMATGTTHGGWISRICAAACKRAESFLKCIGRCPTATPDNRQGWYVQLGYFLNQVHLPGFPEMVENFVQKLEPLVRYSGVNQRAVVADEITS